MLLTWRSQVEGGEVVAAKEEGKWQQWRRRRRAVEHRRMRRAVMAATAEGSVVGCVLHSRERRGDDGGEAKL